MRTNPRSRDFAILLIRTADRALFYRCRAEEPKGRAVRYSSLTVNFRETPKARALHKLAIIAPLCAAAFLSGCQNMPEPYAPPEQRQTFENFRPYRVSQIINMGDVDAEKHFVKDITPTGNGSWNWTGKRPTVSVVMRSVDNLRYTIDFTIAGATFEKTGPVTVSFYVNDHLLDAVHYTAPGNQHFEKTIPDGWVELGKPTTVAAEVDKLWVSPDDGMMLGLILTRIGIEQK